MPLLKDGQITEDTWQSLAEDVQTTPEGDLIVSLEQWQVEGDELRARNGRLGLRLKSDQSPAQFGDDIEGFDLIALEFPRFGDGRAYSYARLLRERYGFTGELRAVGNVLRDQLFFMLRCGFDSFEIAKETAPSDWQAAISEFSVWYQPATDRRKPVGALRRTAISTAER